MSEAAHWCATASDAMDGTKTAVTTLQSMRAVAAVLWVFHVHIVVALQCKQYDTVNTVLMGVMTVHALHTLLICALHVQHDLSEGLTRTGVESQGSLAACLFGDSSHPTGAQLKVSRAAGVPHEDTS